MARPRAEAQPDDEILGETTPAPGRPELPGVLHESAEAPHDIPVEVP